jgi:hypothetical protein
LRFFVGQVEADALTLPQESEEGTVKTARFEEDFGAVVVADDDSDARGVVIGFDEPLGHAFSTFPALMQDVQTLARRELVPYLTRIF